MRKSDKKIDNRLRQLLTEVCDEALESISGYQWISHSVNYNQFPDSLSITCMFLDKQSAQDAQQQGEILRFIKQKLSNASITLNNEQKQIRFESQ